VRRVALVAAPLLLIGARAAAHQSSVAYSEIVVDGHEVDYTIQIASADLYEAVGVERDREVSRDEVRRGRERLFDYLLRHVHVAEGGAECTGAPTGLDFLDKQDGFFATVKLRYSCPRAVEHAAVRYDLFFDLDPRHQGFARIAFGEEEGRQQVFRDGARTLAIERDLTVWDHVRDYLRLGVEHIFTGYDHIAFLFGLLVIAGREGVRRGARRILGVVTAFTLAHSVTLIASALGLVAIPPRIVEPAIALSIVYVGVENLVQPAPAHRFALTFGFGLVHGFGFASVLREIGLPHKGLLLSLVSFNVGVELGQLAVVAAVLPLLALIAQKNARMFSAETSLVPGVATATFLLLRRFGVAPAPLAAVAFGGAPLVYLAGRRWGYDRAVRLGGSTAIALLAAFWFVERALGRSLLGGLLG
jgi:hypothetical protein